MLLDMLGGSERTVPCLYRRAGLFIDHRGDMYVGSRAAPSAFMTGAHGRSVSLRGTAPDGTSRPCSTLSIKRRRKLFDDAPAVRSWTPPAAIGRIGASRKGLGHLNRQGSALGKIRRVLVSGGPLILTVPHLSRLHEEPHDVWRYACHGPRYLLEAWRPIVLELGRTAPLLAGHQLSIAHVGGPGTYGRSTGWSSACTAPGSPSPA